jgi:magnesium and cobalt transporter
MPIDELNDLLEVNLPDEGWDTIAGLVLGLFGRIPKQGEEVRFDGLVFRAERVLGRRIAKVLVTRVPEEEGAEERELV